MNKHLDDFMKAFPFEGLTYDDVSLVTQYADFLPDDTSLETKLTSRMKMKVPFMSAAMDTVTEAPMAIAMALAGGIGCIHKNLEEDEQSAQVARVKNHLNGLIATPVCFHENDDISFLRSEKLRMGTLVSPVKSMLMQPCSPGFPSQIAALATSPDESIASIFIV